MLKLIGVIIFVMAIATTASFGLKRVLRWLFSIDEILEALKEIKEEI